MISVNQAIDVVLSEVKVAGIEAVPLQQALGRVLADNVHADMDLPPFDRARMDGFAVRSDDVRSAPVRLRLVGEIAAGAAFGGKVCPGEAVKIFTGAPLPAGADAVQKVEVTESDNSTVLINEPVGPGQFITPRGSEVHRNDLVARAGRMIGPAEMAVLASFGYAEVKVGAKPRVAVISTGSELVDVSSSPSGAQIRNSNNYTIASYALLAGATIVMQDTVPDRLDLTREILEQACEESDFVITSGGVSMGDYDLVKEALTALDAKSFFERVRIRPGKPIVFARVRDTWFFGLPGNPVSTSVTFNVFVRPALRKIQGDKSPMLPVVRAGTELPVEDPSNRRSYLPGLLRIEDGGATVRPLKWGGSSDLVAFRNANALIIVPEDVHHIARGELAEVMLLGSPGVKPKAE